jgi:hypothetical protein
VNVAVKKTARYASAYDGPDLVDQYRIVASYIDRIRPAHSPPAIFASACIPLLESF